MPKQPMIVGNPVLIVVDIQKSAFMRGYDNGIPRMPNYYENLERARSMVDAAHEADIPVIFFQEIHRKDMIDYGRELDGDEDVHCLEGRPGTPVAADDVLDAGWIALADVASLPTSADVGRIIALAYSTTPTIGPI